MGEFFDQWGGFGNGMGRTKLRSYRIILQKNSGVCISGSPDHFDTCFLLTVIFDYAFFFHEMLRLND